MKKVEVIIGDGVEQISLDLNTNSISIALQYSIDDVRDIDKKNSNYSKTITLPGTKKNNKAFGNLFDINSDFTQYNPNLKKSARIVVDSSPVLEGYIQLLSVNKLNNADLQGNLISYEVILFDDAVDFYQTIGDKLIVGNSIPSDDLDFSELDHTYNQTNIENAWYNHTFEDVYQYPLLDKNTKTYFTNDFKPCFYHKALLMKIASDAGYTLKGSFITDNENYEKEIIAWDGNTPKMTDSEAIAREFKAGISTTTTSVASGVKDGFETWGSLNIRNVFNYDDVTPANGFYDNTGDYKINQSIIGGIGSTYTAPKTGRYNFKIVNNFDISYQAGSSCIMRDLDTLGPISDSNGPYAKITATMRYRDDDSLVGSQSITNFGRYNSFSSGGTKNITRDGSFIFPNLAIEAGREIYITFGLTTDKNFSWFNGSIATPVTVTLKVNKNLSGGGLSFMENDTVQVQNIQDGDIIEINQYLPLEIKQKDIIIDLVRRYNVYIVKDSINPKTLLLQTRDSYYDDNTTVLDWTQKKDYSNQDKIQFLSELQNKEILFTYKEANDLVSSGGRRLNEVYTKSTGDIYGQKRISFVNDFVKGVKKIESIFSTAPLVFKGKIGNNVVVSSVDSSESVRNSCLLYWGGMLPVQDENGISEELDISWGSSVAPFTTATKYSTYPYAGHYDNPYNSQWDLHYGQITYEFYAVPLSKVTDNNLFNNYWRNYYEQIKEGRLVTSSFYLKETDINFIKDNLNTSIFIKDSYYVINKIIDYKPLEDGLTRVELLKINKGSTFQPEQPVLSGVFIAVADGDTTMSTNNTGPYRSSITSSVNSPDSLTLGQRNYVGSGSNVSITGDDNNVGGNSTGISIIGDNNVVDAGVENVIIVGDNQTITESNTSYINGTTFTLASPLSGLWERGTGSESLIQVNSAAPNTASNIYSITTGVQNTNDGMFSGILSGAANTINPLSDASVLAGGQTNTITGVNNFIGGGFNNNIGAPTTTRENSAIIAGSNNNVNVDYSVIVGGQTNTITGNESIILGGSSNINGSSRSAILGGYDNDLSNGVNSTILGGESNSIVGDRNAIIGGTNNTLDTSLTSIGSSVIVGGSVNVVGSTSERSSIIGGTINNITGSLSSIISGSNNTLSGDSSIIVGGSNNIIEHIQSVIISNGSSLTGAGSMNNYIFGGLNHIISAPAMFNNIVGGNNNEISGPTLFGGIISSTVSKIINASSSSNIIGAGSSEIDTGTYVNIFGGQNITISKNSFSYTLGGQLNGLSSGGAPSETHSGIIGGVSNTIDSSYSLILHSNLSSISKTTVGSTGVYNIILGGQDHIINVDTNNNNAILGGNNNTISSTTNRSLILGGQNITATQDDTAYLPKLVVTETYIPTGTTDVNGVVGEISYDGSYVYVKTTSGWLRSTLSTF